jgi:hypothetical protein
VRQLLATAICHSRDQGAHMLELIGFPESVRRSVSSLRPFHLVDDSCPFLFRGVAPGLHESLNSAGVWHACLYDGDGSL